MSRSARTPAPFGKSQLAFRFLRWKPKWIPPPRFVALMNEDEGLDLVVVSTFDSLDVCCHQELLKMPINGLLRLIVDLNSRLPIAMQIMDALTKSEDLLRRDIEAVLGYRRFSPMNPETPLTSSRDSGLGLLGILSASQPPDARTVPPTLSSRTLQPKGSNNSLNDRQKLTVSMRGKPRLADLMEEEQETGGSTQSAAGRSPIRRSDRRHSLTKSRRDRHIGEAATLPRAHNMRNLQNCEGRRIPPQALGRGNSDRSNSNFDPPAFGSFIRAKPRLYHSLPTSRRKIAYETSFTRQPRFRRDLRHIPTLGSQTSGHLRSNDLRKPSLELSEMDQLIRNMLSVPTSAGNGRSINSDLQEFGVLRL